MVALGCLLYQQPLFGLPIFLIGQSLLTIAAALTLWSGLDYLRVAWPSLQK
jgi:phosphatidylglycerophosphate synthase